MTVTCRYCNRPARECQRIEGAETCRAITLDCRGCGKPLGRKITPTVTVRNDSPHMNLDPPLRPIECDSCGVRTVGVISMPEPKEPTFVQELEHLINKHSQENPSGTPEFILAEYMLSCLDAFNKAVQDRERWYGRRTNARFEIR